MAISKYLALHYMLKPRISALMKGEMGNEVKENPKISLESPWNSS